MNPGSDGATAQLDASTGPPEDSLSPRPGSGERVRQKGFQKRATNRWNVPVSPALSMNREVGRTVLSPPPGSGAVRTPRPACWRGSWFQCMASKSWGLSMNLPSERGQPCPRDPAPAHSRTRLSALRFSGSLRTQGSLRELHEFTPMNSVSNLSASIREIRVKTPPLHPNFSSVKS